MNATLADWQDMVLPERMMQIGGDPDLLRDEILHVIASGMAAHPRSLQKRIGPSEVGTPCTRRVGHKLAGTPEINTTDGWLATIGTSVHDWLAATFTADLRLEVPGQELTDGRWLVETKVTAGSINGDDIDGSCDIYDRLTATVIDWKVTSSRKIRDYRANGPGDQYRIQAHAYGNGWLHKGLPVDRVGVFFLPRDTPLRAGTVHFWTEAHDPAVAQAAFARAGDVDTLLAALGPAAALPLLPTADAYCAYCPWFQAGATDLTTACPGDPGAAPNSTPAPALTFST